MVNYPLMCKPLTRMPVFQTAVVVEEGIGVTDMVAVIQHMADVRCNTTATTTVSVFLNRC